MRRKRMRGSNILTHVWTLKTVPHLYWGDKKSPVNCWPVMTGDCMDDTSIILDLGCFAWKARLSLLKMRACHWCFSSYRERQNDSHLRTRRRSSKLVRFFHDAALLRRHPYGWASFSVVVWADASLFGKTIGVMTCCRQMRSKSKTAHCQQPQPQHTGRQNLFR